MTATEIQRNTVFLKCKLHHSIGFSALQWFLLNLEQSSYQELTPTCFSTSPFLSLCHPSSHWLFSIHMSFVSILNTNQLHCSLWASAFALPALQLTTQKSPLQRCLPPVSITLFHSHVYFHCNSTIWKYTYLYVVSSQTPTLEVKFHKIRYLVCLVQNCICSTWMRLKSGSPFNALTGQLAYVGSKILAPCPNEYS